MEIQNLLNSVFKNASVESKDLLSRLKVGDLLRAKVLSMVGDSIMLEVNGKFTLEAKDMSSIRYNVGDLIEFTVADMSEDKFIIKSNISKLALFESKLSEMGIKLDDENKELIKLLFKNQIPITKENLSTISSTKNYYGKLFELIKESNLPVSSETINSDVKEALKNLITSNEVDLADKSSQQVLKTMSNENQSNVSSNINSSFPFINEFLDGENKNPLEKLVFMLKNGLDFNIKDNVLVDNIVSGKKTITSQIEGLIKLLDDETTSNNSAKDNIVIDKSIQDNDYKNKLIKIMQKFEASEENSIKDSSTLEKGLQINTLKNKPMGPIQKSDISEDENIKDSINPERVLQNNDQKSKLIKLMQKLDASSIKDKEEFTSTMKELFQSLDDIKNSISNSENRNLISKHIDEIKTSFDFVNRLNESMAFIQVPININNSQKNLDIYIKKDAESRKKINSQNAKIFISLNTNNLDLVQVLIELNKKDINLNFRITNKKIRKVIENNEALLANKLKEYDFNNVIFKYSVNDEKMDLTNLDFSDKKSKLNTLDIKV
ncbi:hypothetical protein R9X47_02505 [Wukongibacter baidiensis]|uniref:hypothetical protein n=1 Tax=Wukongibacter baidiensis TaxID=1723361 RepID=UPI003D7F8E1F